jgi:hypothetical protein
MKNVQMKIMNIIELCLFLFMRLKFVVKFVCYVSISANVFRLGGSGGKLAIFILESTTLQLLTTVLGSTWPAIPASGTSLAKPMLAVVALFLVSCIVKQFM